MEKLHQRLIRTMNVDPCRRFTIGATVERTCIRLWIYNRIIIVASESFDFNLVSIFNSIIFMYFVTEKHTLRNRKYL